MSYEHSLLIAVAYVGNDYANELNYQTYVYFASAKKIYL